MEKVKKIFSNNQTDPNDPVYIGQGGHTGGHAGSAEDSYLEHQSGGPRASNVSHTSNTTGISDASTKVNQATSSGVPGVDKQGQLPVREGVTGRHEESGTPLRTAGAGAGGAFTNPHDLGHSTLKDAHNVDPQSATHEHQHLAPVTHENVRHTEVEEVQRQKEHDRHVHHVQHHTQPVLDKHVQDEVHHDRVHPVTKIHEQHKSTDQDHKSFAALNTHRNETTHAPVERQIVDKGETVNENVHHHVHHVTQPVVEREVHDRHRIHTVIPTHHTTHEAPIVHQSATHEPVHMKDFLSGGGKLDSTLTHDKAGVLSEPGDCTREVDGVGEKLASDLHLKQGTTANQHSTSTHV